MPRFKIGDLIRGTKNNKYYFTNQFSVCEVTRLEDTDGYIIVKIIKHFEPSKSDIVKKHFEVQPEYFELVKSSLENKPTNRKLKETTIIKSKLFGYNHKLPKSHRVSK